MMVVRSDCFHTSCTRRSQLLTAAQLHAQMLPQVAVNALTGAPPTPTGAVVARACAFEALPSTSSASASACTATIGAPPQQRACALGRRHQAPEAGASASKTKRAKDLRRRSGSGRATSQLRVTTPVAFAAQGTTICHAAHSAAACQNLTAHLPGLDTQSPPQGHAPSPARPSPVVRQAPLACVHARTALAGLCRRLTA